MSPKSRNLCSPLVGAGRWKMDRRMTWCMDGCMHGGQVWVLIISSFFMGSTPSSWSGGTHHFAPTQILLEISFLALQPISKGPTKGDRRSDRMLDWLLGWLHQATPDPALQRPERKVQQEQHRSLAPWGTYSAPPGDWQTGFQRSIISTPSQIFLSPTSHYDVSR